jgi:hypothetical protein
LKLNGLLPLVKIAISANFAQKPVNKVIKHTWSALNRALVGLKDDHRYQQMVAYARLPFHGEVLIENA